MIFFWHTIAMTHLIRDEWSIIFHQLSMEVMSEMVSATSHQRWWHTLLTEMMGTSDRSSFHQLSIRDDTILFWHVSPEMSDWSSSINHPTEMMTHSSDGTLFWQMIEQSEMVSSHQRRWHYLVIELVRIDDDTIFWSLISIILASSKYEWFIFCLVFLWLLECLVACTPWSSACLGHQWFWCLHW